jgi:hypothetical protein
MVPKITQGLPPCHSTSHGDACAYVPTRIGWIAPPDHQQWFSDVAGCKQCSVIMSITLLPGRIYSSGVFVHPKCQMCEAHTQYRAGGAPPYASAKQTPKMSEVDTLQKQYSNPFLHGATCSQGIDTAQIVLNWLVKLVEWDITPIKTRNCIWIPRGLRQIKARLACEAC